MACSTTVCGILCFDKEWCRSTLPCYIPPQQLLGSACELPPSQTPVPTIPHLSTSAVLRSVLGIWQDCLRNPWRSAARAQHHTGKQMDLAQQFGLTNLPTLPSPGFRVSDTCLWDKYQATEEVTLRGGIIVRSELHNCHQREDTREALRPCATRDYSSRYSEERGQNDPAPLALCSNGGDPF